MLPYGSQQLDVFVPPTSLGMCQWARKSKVWIGSLLEYKCPHENIKVKIDLPWKDCCPQWTFLGCQPKFNFCEDSDFLVIQFWLIFSRCYLLQTRLMLLFPECFWKCHCMKHGLFFVSHCHCELLWKFCESEGLLTGIYSQRRKEPPTARKWCECSISGSFKVREHRPFDPYKPLGLREVFILKWRCCELLVLIEVSAQSSRKNCCVPSVGCLAS